MNFVLDTQTSLGSTMSSYAAHSLAKTLINLLVSSEEEPSTCHYNDTNTSKFRLQSAMQNSRKPRKTASKQKLVFDAPTSKQMIRKRKLVVQRSYTVIAVKTPESKNTQTSFQKEITAVGVYSTKQAAEVARRNMMECHRSNDREKGDLKLFIREDSARFSASRSIFP